MWKRSRVRDEAKGGFEKREGDEGEIEFTEISISVQQSPPEANPPLPPYAYANQAFLPSIYDNGNELKGDLEVIEGGQPQRMVWDNQWEFLMSCISMSVGLGNVWRFPVVAYKNGGGAFLIPYLIVLVFIGRPIYFLELCLGQFTSFSQVKVWKCVPFFKGVGYSSMIATMSVLTYYVSIMSLTSYYFLMSFKRSLPWSECDPQWADVGSCNGSGLNGGFNRSIPQMYFINEVLHEYANIENGIGNPDWRLSASLAFCWLVIFLSLLQGVKSSGKVAYFTAIFPYIVMLILLIRGVTLTGSWDGIKYFIQPDFSKLLDPNVWYAAVGQCFFSLNTGFGSIVMFSSYNPFSHNIYRDAWIISLMDTFTSLLAGFTIFAVLGNLAHELNVPVKDVVQDGTALAFISYPDAIAKFQYVPQLFAVLFFVMLFTLGIGSSMSDAGAVITIFCDQFPNLKRWKVTTLVCLIGCAIGIVYCTPGGQFILTLVDYFGGGFIIYLASTLEIIGIAWVYGLYSFISDIEFMLNIRIGWYWKLCWGFIIPVFLTLILIYSFIEDGSVKYNNIPYPVIPLVFGWLIAGVALGAFPIAALHSIHISPGNSYLEKVKASLQPTKDWGPRNLKIRAEWNAYKSTLIDNTFLDEFKGFQIRVLKAFRRL